ncbi:protein capL [Legionella beliardensis]|uniref:Protein capL n=1 Tax=Legionella beliardensis TaxID=91822 RepID=A0A378I4I2_9GAMM|nr:nucleotide sugar dehydrogenase [Legionella beliardensis]STX29742.1 protein capL [Legionella beliardensis]
MKTIAIVGLGYVGLELAVSLSKKYRIIGYDILEQRIQELRAGHDRNNLVSDARLAKSLMTYTTDIQDIADATVYIVTVSTPAYYYLIPNLEPLLKATRDLSQFIKKGDLIIFESTVYPGTVDEDLIPLIEKISHMKSGEDFHVGYSPERINPNDKVHTLQTVPKVIAGQNEHALSIIKEVYSACCDELYPVSNIKTAEAVKILENVQRDINIAIMNEFTEFMHALDINMYEVLEAAKTKWNFLSFKPGFVGGHCIAVDPLYLAFKAKQEGINYDLIQTARKINDNITHFIRYELLNLMVTHNLGLKECTIGIFGITYKENTPDFRNSIALKLIKEMKKYGFHFKVNDPFADPSMVSKKYHFDLIEFDQMNDIDIAIIINAHHLYCQASMEGFAAKFSEKVIIMDIPNIFANEAKNYPNIVYWNL